MRWRAQGVAREVTGHARSPGTRAIAREIGLCDRVCDSAAEAVEEADLVVLCVPVGVMGAVAAEIAPALKPGATLSDVGSVKRAVIEAVTPHLPRACISCPRIRSRGPSIPARVRALPSFLTTAGA